MRFIFYYNHIGHPVSRVLRSHFLFILQHRGNFPSAVGSSFFIYLGQTRGFYIVKFNWRVHSWLVGSPLEIRVEIGNSTMICVKQWSKLRENVCSVAVRSWYSACNPNSFTVSSVDESVCRILCRPNSCRMDAYMQILTWLISLFQYILIWSSIKFKN